jgi:hypothetical protein
VLTAAPPAPPKFTSPESYTPRHLAERILTSKSALEGERKQVTVLFADLKGSMELLADRDPEEARRLLDPVLTHMMEGPDRRGRGQPAQPGRRIRWRGISGGGARGCRARGPGSREGDGRLHGITHHDSDDARSREGLASRDPGPFFDALLA